MLVFDCPSCGGKLQMPETLAGKKVRCATCQAVITAPADGAVAVQAHAPASNAASQTAVSEGAPRRSSSAEDDDREGRGPRRDRPAKKGMGAGVIIAIVAVLCVGCLVCGGGVVALLLVFPAIGSVRDSAARAQTANNMKQISLANINYCDTFRGEMPTPRLLTPPQKQQSVDLSWRVSILPFLEQQPLFNRFDQTLPWDNPRNQPLVNPMPVTYEHPLRDHGKKGMTTFFQYFTGPETLWPDNTTKRRYPASITDGTSNTFLFAEAADGVAWSKAADMTVQRAGPLPLPADRFMAAFADGHVATVNRARVNDQGIFAGITPAAGDIAPLNWD